MDVDLEPRPPPPATLIHIPEEDSDLEIELLTVKPPSSLKKKKKRRRRITGNSKNNAIPVDDYDGDFSAYQINKAILSSLSTVVDLSSIADESDDVVQIMEWPNFPEKVHKKAFSAKLGNSIREQGESSKSREIEINFVCEICVEPKPSIESFTIKGCRHSYCTECMNNYVAARLQDNITEIGCPVPDCRGTLEPEHCRSILPEEVFNRWGSALCEAVILGSEKFYCPYKDCSAMMIDDRASNEECLVITQSECPNCRRLFCVQCKVAWHSGIRCKEFQSLNKDERQAEDIMLMKLAADKNWKRCSVCKYYVERTEGCLYMRCRCGNTFCYNCGTNYQNSTHYCSNCKH